MCGPARRSRPHCRTRSRGHGPPAGQEIGGTLTDRRGVPDPVESPARDLLAELSGHSALISEPITLQQLTRSRDRRPRAGQAPLLRWYGDRARYDGRARHQRRWRQRLSMRPARAAVLTAAVRAGSLTSERRASSASSAPIVGRQGAWTTARADSAQLQIDVASGHNRNSQHGGISSSTEVSLTSGCWARAEVGLPTLCMA